MTGALAGRRVLITGAARGIGRATLERFVREGAAIVAIDRDGHTLEATCAEVARSGAKIMSYAADVANEAAVETATEVGMRFLGGLDGVVNCAGIDLIADIERMSAADWNKILSVNLTAPVLVMRACYPHLRANSSGTIVNVSSGAGLSPLMHRTAYCASKAGLQMASKALAIEAAPFGIRVNCVCPGAVETSLFRESIDSAATYEAVKTRYALKRVAEPHEIAAAILWLTSAESSYVTGTAMAVDGGRTFH